MTFMPSRRPLLKSVTFAVGRTDDPYALGSW